MKKTVLPMLALALLAGCVAPVTPQYDVKFGQAVREARMAQTIDPEAGKKDQPVAGIDGKAAVAAMTGYQKSFAPPPPPPINIISVGNQSTAR